MGAQIETSEVEQILNNIEAANFNPDDFYSSFCLAYQNTDLNAAKLSTLLHSNKKLSVDQANAIIGLATYLSQLEATQLTSGYNHRFKDPKIDYVKGNKENTLGVFVQNYNLLAKHANDQIFILEYLITNMDGLEDSEKTFLNSVVKWQKDIVSEITSLKANILMDDFQTYADAVCAYQNLQAKYYHFAVFATKIIGIALLIAAPVFFIWAIPLATSAAMIAGGLDGLAIIGIELGMLGLGVSGFITIDHGANALHKAGWLDTAMNFFSHNKANDLLAKRDIAKTKYAKTKKLFDDRGNTIKSKIDQAPEASNSLARFAGIFVAPIRGKFDTVTEAQENMDSTNKKTTFSEFSPPERWQYQ